MKVNHIWIGSREVPEEYLKNYSKWEDSTIWYEEELLSLCTDQQVTDYMKIEHLINRINYLKYILMYEKGGIYADLDAWPVKDLNDFFELTKVEGIDKYAKMSIRYPFNTEIPEKRFGDYDIILPARLTMFFYPNGAKPTLLDNPVLMSKPKQKFWLKLVEHCMNRQNNKDVPHEPYGPYGMSDFLFTNYYKPYMEGILVLPFQYLMEAPDKIGKTTYIVHEAKSGW